MSARFHPYLCRRKAVGMVNFMSEKARDPKGRWRNVSVSFRVSPEESSFIDSLVKLSGLTKQEYLARRVTQKDVVVQGNPKVYKALKTQMKEIHTELLRLTSTCEVSNEFMELLGIVAKICNEMK